MPICLAPSGGFRRSRPERRLCGYAVDFVRGCEFWLSLSPSSTRRGFRFRSLLADLGTLTLNQACLPGRPDSRFLLVSKPTELQARAFNLLGMGPDRDAYASETT